MDSSPASVLVVEDNPDTADSLARFLRLAVGYDVRVAYDGAAGVKAALADPPDAVVCDISLPRVHGLRVAEEIVAGLKVKPLLIALTALGGIYPEDDARAAGFDHWLTKPADPFAIERLISEHVCRARAGPT
jgi:DNA-binding response OmpR family regulator